MPEGQSDGLPLADLVQAARHARAAADRAGEEMRPLWQREGRARAELAAEVVRGLLAGEQLATFTPALEVLGAPADWTEGSNYGAIDRLGGEFLNWLRFTYGRP